MLIDVTGKRVRLTIAMALMALMVSSGMVYRASTAAFTATTTNPSDAWTAGSVSLTDDDTGSAMFSATGLTPSSTGSKCIVISYGGNVASTVSLYGTAVGALGAYVNLTIETGSGSTFAAASCAGFVSGATIYSGTLAAFAAASTNFSTGVPTAGSRWAPSSAATNVYKIAYTITDTNSAMGATVAATFTWEAQST